MRSLHEQIARGKRLGRKGVRHDPRTLKFERYVIKIPAVPPMVDHTSKVGSAFEMDGNDKYGDCVMAAFAHGILDWTTYASTPKQPTEQQVIDAYLKLSPDDQGLVVLDALNLWRNPGFWNDKIYAFASLEAGNTAQAEAAIYCFGFIVVGMSLPDSNTFGPWTDVQGAPDPANGHCVILTGFDRNAQMFDAISWGSVMKMSYAWYSKYAGPEGQGEGYAVLSQDWLSDQGLDPEGFDWPSLQQDLSDITGVVAPPPPPPGPGPNPSPGCFHLPKKLLHAIGL